MTTSCPTSLPCFVRLSHFPSFLPFVLVSWWKCNQRNASEGMKLKFLSTVFQEEAKKAGEEIRNWWAEEVCDRVSNEGNRGSDKWEKPLLSKLWHPLKHVIGPSGVVALWLYHLFTDVCAKLIVVCIRNYSPLFNTDHVDVYFTSLSRNLWFISWDERCFKRTAVLKRIRPLFWLLICRSKDLVIEI